jgi:hypothetical protein
MQFVGALTARPSAQNLAFKNRAFRAVPVFDAMYYMIEA